MNQNDNDMHLIRCIVREQLITLWAFHKRHLALDEFQKFLTEGLSPSCLNLTMFNQICYFLLGLINREERDKLIKWPIINIQDQTKFRKAVSAMVKDLIVKYPHFQIKKLPESYLVDPNHNQKKVLDFIMRLCNIAISLSLDPSFLVMTNRSGLNENEIETAITIIKQARTYEERIIEENEFPFSKFENIRMCVRNKCVAVKQENSSLNTHLINVKKNLMEEGILKSDVSHEVDYLKEIYESRLDELKNVNKNLQVYCDAAKEVLYNIKAIGNPIQLAAKDLNLDKGEPNFLNATIKSCDRLKQLFDFLRSKDVQVKEKEEFLKNLQSVKELLLKEQNLLQSFTEKHTGKG